MTIRGSQAANRDEQPENDRDSGDKAQLKNAALPPDVQARLRKANEYFDKHPPRANSSAELAAFIENA